MSEMTEKPIPKIKYKELAAIDTNLLNQIKLVFIFTKYSASDVIFVTKTDDVFGFGTNQYGRLGFGHNSEVSDPTIIPEFCAKDIQDIDFGQQFMVAITESMEVYTCGYDCNGMLGNGTNSGNYRKPQKIDIGDKFIKEIKCCVTSSYLLTDTNEMFYFGYRQSIVSVTPSPTLINCPNQKVITICCGYEHTLALTDFGKVYTFGMNGSGQLGLGHANNTAIPVLVQFNDVFVKSVSCGNHHSLLLTTDGEVFAFGYNAHGQLGTGNTSNQLRPVQIGADYKFTEIFAFDDISMALNENNNVLVWGKGTMSSPFKTNMSTFQEVIDGLSPKTFTYKPLSIKDIIVNKPVNRVIETMAKAFNDQKYSDLKFKLKRKGSEEFCYIYGHKWFIAKNSQHFENMFANNWSENNSNEIEINDYSHEAYYQFIRCLYTDSIETDDREVLIELLAITDMYLDEEMKTKCVQKIKPLMKVENVSSFYSNALKYRSKELEKFCYRFMTRNINSIVNTEDYEAMDPNYAKNFFTQFTKQKR